jgi:hypothetical protein
MVLPVEIAERSEFPPHQIVSGEAVTLVGIAGGITVTVIGVLEELIHEVPDQEIEICPFPDLTPPFITPAVTPPIYEEPPPPEPPEPHVLPPPPP